MTLLEELDRKDRGEATEDVEVVPLDDVADRCGDDDAAQLVERNFLSRHGPPLCQVTFAAGTRRRRSARDGACVPGGPPKHGECQMRRRVIVRKCRAARGS